MLYQATPSVKAYISLNSAIYYRKQDDYISETSSSAIRH